MLLCTVRVAVYWISQAGVIMASVAVNYGYVRLVLSWTVLLFIVDKSGWCYCGLCCCL